MKLNLNTIQQVKSYLNYAYHDKKNKTMLLSTKV